MNLPLLYEDPLPRISCLHGHGFSASEDLVIDRIDESRKGLHRSSDDTHSFHAWRRDRVMVLLQEGGERGNKGSTKGASEESCPKSPSTNSRACSVSLRT